MRAGIRDDRIRDRTITAYVDLDQFLTNLDIPSNETIYWFLIEKDSKNILTRGYGIIAEEDLDLINSFYLRIWINSKNHLYFNLNLKLYNNFFVLE